MGTEYGQLVGHEIGHWRVVRLLGTGGFGAVYEAQHKHIAGRLAAIKVLHPLLLLRGDADDLTVLRHSIAEPVTFSMRHCG